MKKPIFALGWAITSVISCAEPAAPRNASLTRPGEVDALSARAVASDYSITDLGTLGGTSSSAQAINEKGEIVGSSATRSGPIHAFFRTVDGRMLDIGDFSPQDVNAAGDVVGFRVVSSPAGNVAYAVFWSASTGVIELGEGVAQSINDLGQIVGSVAGMGAAFWPLPNDPPVALGGGAAQGINNAGLVVGYTFSASVQQAVRWRNVNGSWVMESLSNSPYTSAFSVNVHGDVAGGGCPSLEPTSCPEHHAFLWPAGGGEVALESLGGPRRHAYGMNDNGDVVGFATNGAGKQRAVIWPAAGGVADLGLMRGGAEAEARDINSSGVIVGVVRSNSGRGRAVAWTRR